MRPSEVCTALIKALLPNIEGMARSLSETVIDSMSRFVTHHSTCHSELHIDYADLQPHIRLTPTPVVRLSEKESDPSMGTLEFSEPAIIGASQVFNASTPLNKLKGLFSTILSSALRPTISNPLKVLYERKMASSESYRQILIDRNTYNKMPIVFGYEMMKAAMVMPLLMFACKPIATQVAEYVIPKKEIAAPEDHLLRKTTQGIVLGTLSSLVETAYLPCENFFTLLSLKAQDASKPQLEMIKEAFIEARNEGYKGVRLQFSRIFLMVAPTMLAGSLCIDPKNPLWKNMVIASTISVTAQMAVTPLNAIRITMLQMHSNQSTAQTAQLILKEEGIKGFYKGASAVIIRQLIGGLFMGKVYAELAKETH
ncbi:MAG: MC/SLC25 family protein [Simkaniaceae bacterium]|nr:MC/SLC25 family protein [Simkaniaceae bacterium]MCF7852984.1 MC/SLC25 family protein [Simkaniaceae bacterium]